jgi:NADH-quinone oxidoreductase subunit J
MSGEIFLFLTLALIAVLTALGMLFSKNTVYAALNLVINFITVAIFYLLLDAPFISLAQVTVYAGAIMVLFLFVIMLLGIQQISAELNWRSLILPGVLAAILLVEGLYLMLARTGAGLAFSVTTTAALANPSEMSKQLFSDYLLPFEATSILLLVAMVGAIVLTKKEKGGDA